MNYLIMLTALISILLNGALCLGWDGFDAATSDLVEISPDRIPRVGDQVVVYEYESEAKTNCIVENIIRNRRTIEVMVLDPAGSRRILVMEGR